MKRKIRKERGWKVGRGKRGGGGADRVDQVWKKRKKAL